MTTLITNIHQLAFTESEISLKRVPGKEMCHYNSLHNAWLLVENELIYSFGSMENMPELNADSTIDATGRLVLPAWCDSHTHLVFAASRENEFVDRINGLTYQEIAKRGGGILNSAAKMAVIDEGLLYEQSARRLVNVILQGTGAIEIKSGYGLNLEAELKMLRIIRKLKDSFPVSIKSSFLAAHSYPIEYQNNKKEYVNKIINEMLPVIASEGLADYMDVFCEEGFFGIAETERLLEAGLKYGLKPKIHANQFHISGGVQTGIKYGAVSVDHLECVGDSEIEALRNSATIPTLLPGAAFFLGMHYQPARMMIDANLPVCLATDYNPGTCPSGNVPLLLTIACTQMKMTPAEAINAVTLNGAAALELENELGTVAMGKRANLIITHRMPSIDYIPYDYGNNPVAQIIINGKTFTR